MAWASLNTPGYCWYNNDSVTYSNPYGALYNWYTVNTGKLAPKGWHVPTDAEWDTLITISWRCDGGRKALKSTGTTYWQSPNTGATNSSGFSALPGGYRDYFGKFFSVGYNGNWWSSTAFNAKHSWYRYMDYNNMNVNRDNYSGLNNSGFSVRCVRD
jgi:uncharacterized protein (TIGR02145 family)